MKTKLRLTKDDLLNLEAGWNVDVKLNGVWGYLYANEYGDIRYKGKRYSVNYYAPNDEDYEIEEEK